MSMICMADSIAVYSPSLQLVDNTGTLVAVFAELQSMIDQSRKTVRKICGGKNTRATDQSSAGETDTETVANSCVP